MSSHLSQQPVHFAPSFFTPIPELSFHLPARKVAESPWQPHSFAIVNDCLCQDDSSAALPQGAETDLRKIRDFISEHLWEIGTVPKASDDNPLFRIRDRVIGVDFLIAKHNYRVENSLWIRILSIVLSILTFGSYNYKNSLLIDHIAMDNIKAQILMSFFIASGHSLTEEGKSQREILEIQQSLLSAALSDGEAFKKVVQKHAGLADALFIVLHDSPLPKEATEIETIARCDGCVFFYRSGPTASLSMFAECPNGIQIYDKKFSCVASAFEYKRCRDAKCSEEQLEKFTSLDGEAAFTYGATLTQQGQNDTASMEEIVQAKYAQNLPMLDLLRLTENAELIFHTPEESKEGFWSDGGNGSGRDEFGKILEKIRARVSLTVPNPQAQTKKEPPNRSRFADNPPRYEIF